MRSAYTRLHDRRGFTLVELLAVIAIIGILAAIVVPNVARYMKRARVTKAVSEINNAQTALIGVLSDTRRSNFHDFFRQSNNNNVGLGKLRALDAGIRNANGYPQLAEAIRRAQNFYTEFFYELLRQGRDSEFIKTHIAPEVAQKIGTSYMDLGEDPWGERYEFWVGPAPRLPAGPGGRLIQMPIHRSYRLDPTAPSPNDPDFNESYAFRWNDTTRDEYLQKLPGQPPSLAAQWQSKYNLIPYGYPAEKDLPVYIYSRGPNLVIDAVLPIQMVDNANLPEYFGGGDDPNNWDNEAGWENAPEA